jgi:chloramphenicol-sensitive protein RarD
MADTEGGTPGSPAAAVDPPSAVLSAVLAFGMWGTLPIYWKLVQRFGSDVVVLQRLVWTVVWVLPLLLITKNWHAWVEAMKTPALLRAHGLSALLLTVNWSLFIWANQHGHIVEASLGYFLNPLINVAIGRMLLGESMSRWRTVSIALAAAGVVLQVILVGRLPWIALALALTFAAYGLARRKSPLGSLTGLAMESVVVLPLALGGLAWIASQGRPLADTGSAGDWLLMFLAGACTAAPLLTFAHAARHLRFSTLGLLQFIAPTGQFLIGALMYKEPVTLGVMVSFACIWAGVAVFCAEAALGRMREAAKA